MNYMPLVREYLQIEKQKADEAAKKQLAEEQKRDVEMGGVLDEFVVEVFEAVLDADEMEEADARVMLSYTNGDPLLFDGEETSDNEDGSEDSNGT